MSGLEEWRLVAVCPDYAVSDHGRVMRVTPCKGTRPGRLLKPRREAKGYVRVLLDRRDRMVHRLVAEAFIGPPPTPAHQINHRNGVKADNHVRNLEWVTQDENMAHAAAHGLRPDPLCGEDNPRAKLTERDVAVIRGARGRVTQARLAEMFGVSRSLIWNIQTGRTWHGVLPADWPEIENVLRGRE